MLDDDRLKVLGWGAVAAAILVGLTLLSEPSADPVVTILSGVFGYAGLACGFVAAQHTNKSPQQRGWLIASLAGFSLLILTPILAEM